MATHRYNQLLPPTYANELPAEFARNIHDIVNGLEAAARSDPPQLRGGWDRACGGPLPSRELTPHPHTDAAKWFGKLSAVLTLKYQLSDDEWQRIVHVAVLLAINPTARYGPIDRCGIRPHPTWQPRSLSQRTSWLRTARNLLVKKRPHVKVCLRAGGWEARRSHAIRVPAHLAVAAAVRPTPQVCHQHRLLDCRRPVCGMFNFLAVCTLMFTHDAAPSTPR